MTQKWKSDPNLYNCKTEIKNGVVKKKLDYHKTYVKEFLDSDPIQDWDSISRCIDLWNFSLSRITETIDPIEFKILDVGTKDGQFPAYLKDQGFQHVIGIEIADSYVKFAQSKFRPVIKGDVCNLLFNDNTFNYVFSHHVLGLVPDYFKALTEMFRVLKPGGFLVTLNDIPGNPKKHYSLIKDMNTIYKFLKSYELTPHELIYFGENPNFQNKAEKILMIKKL